MPCCPPENIQYYYTLLYHSKILLVTTCEIYSILEHAFYKLTTHCCHSQARRQLQQTLGGAEGGICIAMCRFVAMLLTERRFDEGTPKVVSLFKPHLNQPSVLFESEDAKQSLVAKHSLANTWQV